MTANRELPNFKSRPYNIMAVVDGSRPDRVAGVEGRMTSIGETWIRDSFISDFHLSTVLHYSAHSRTPTLKVCLEILSQTSDPE